MEKAGLIGLVKIRYIESDDNLSLRGDKLKEAIEADRENGYIPFFVINYINYTIITLLYLNAHFIALCFSWDYWRLRFRQAH